jgi:hypothetical protein
MCSEACFDGNLYVVLDNSAGWVQASVQLMIQRKELQSRVEQFQDVCF